ncbi:hypothetical protein ANN_27941 [Periplaneta americana]|uniref:Uncharacterized protein n=1 Tax=Periplaneta americana TaxID=6978 RepID=A0ABQ8RW15_PERAM|nr:hypothetical protein ANN_27941 [Periplaneta americana]
MFYKRGGLSVESRGRKVPRCTKLSFAPASYSEFVYNATLPHIVSTSEFIDGCIRHSFDLCLPGIENIVLPQRPAYDKFIAINPDKMQDIKKILCYIPRGQLPYYEKIVNSPLAEHRIQNEMLKLH